MVSILGTYVSIRPSRRWGERTVHTLTENHVFPNLLIPICTLHHGSALYLKACLKNRWCFWRKQKFLFKNVFLDLVMDIFENILNAYSYCEPVSCRGITTCASGSLYLEVQELFWATHPKILCLSRFPSLLSTFWSQCSASLGVYLVAIVFLTLGNLQGLEWCEMANGHCVFQEDLLLQSLSVRAFCW